MDGGRGSWLTGVADILALAVAAEHARGAADATLVHDAAVMARRRLAGRAQSACRPPLIAEADAPDSGPRVGRSARHRRTELSYDLIRVARKTRADAATAKWLTPAFGTVLLRPDVGGRSAEDAVDLSTVVVGAETRYEERDPCLAPELAGALRRAYASGGELEPGLEARALVVLGAIWRDAGDLVAVWGAHRVNEILGDSETAEARRLRSRAAGDAACVLRGHRFFVTAARMADRALLAGGDDIGASDRLTMQVVGARARAAAAVAWSNRPEEDVDGRQRLGELLRLRSEADATYRPLVDQVLVDAYLRGSRQDRRAAVPRQVEEAAWERDRAVPIAGSSWQLDWLPIAAWMAIRRGEAERLEALLVELTAGLEAAPMFGGSAIQARALADHLTKQAARGTAMVPHDVLDRLGRTSDPQSSGR